MTHATHILSLTPLLTTGDTTPVALTATLAVGLAGLLGLGIVIHVARRYRSDPDPSLRALAIGISLVAAAPLGLLFLDVGLVPDQVRYVSVSLLQGAGLLAVLRGIYGPGSSNRGWAPRSTADLFTAVLAVATGTAIGAATALLGGATPLAATALGVVVAGGTFVAGQAARAYRRNGDPRMLALSAGTMSLVVVPTPVALALLDHGPAAATLGFAGFFLVGQVLLLATLYGHGR